MFAPGKYNLIRALLLVSVILMACPASSLDYPFGSKVQASQSDVGRPLFRLPDETTVAFWDIGTPGYDEGDMVYLHIGPSASGTTNANDVRLSSLDNLSAGSKVSFLDPDMNMPIKHLPSTISFLDLHGSRAYDLDDPVYLHHFQYGDYSCQDEPADIMTGFIERLPYSGREISSQRLGYVLFIDNYKLFVSDKILDKKPRRVGELQGLGIEVVRGLKADYYHVLGTWLIKIQPHETAENGYPSDQFILTNDLRLSSTGQMIAGTKVANFDEDQNKLVAWPPLASFLGPVTDTAKMGFFDANGNGVYDYEDDVYLNVPAGASKGVVTVNNLRLSGQIL